MKKLEAMTWKAFHLSSTGLEEEDEGAFPTADLTFDLTWKPHSVPAGCVFDAGAVPGFLFARIPVVVIRTKQLIASVVDQLLADDGTGGSEDTIRAGLRLISVSPPNTAAEQ